MTPTARRAIALSKVHFGLSHALNKENDFDLVVEHNESTSLPSTVNGEDSAIMSHGTESIELTTDA